MWGNEEEAKADLAAASNAHKAIHDIRKRAIDRGNYSLEACCTEAMKRISDVTEWCEVLAKPNPFREDDK